MDIEIGDRIGVKTCKGKTVITFAGFEKIGNNKEWMISKSGLTEYHVSNIYSINNKKK